jgi:predicted permease
MVEEIPGIKFTFCVLAILKIISLILIGFLLHRINLLTERIINFLYKSLIYFIVPCWIFNNILKKFVFFPFWWVVPASSVLIPLVGFLFTRIYLLFRRSLRIDNNSRELTGLLAFHNCGYLPASLAYFLFANNTKILEEFLLYIFLYIFGFNLLIWSIVPGLFKGSFRFKEIITPANCTIIISFLMVAFNLKIDIPWFMIYPLEVIGKSCYFISMFVIGSLFSLNLPKISNLITKDKLFDFFFLIFGRLFLIPLVFFLSVYLLKLNNLFGFFLFLQSSMPSAVSLAIISKWKNADTLFVSKGIFFTHLFSLFSILFWLKLYFLVIGF